METVVLVALGIISTLGHLENYGIAAEKHPQLKNIRARREIDSRSFAIEENYHSPVKKHPHTPKDDTIPVEPISMSILKADKNSQNRQSNGNNGQNNAHIGPNNVQSNSFNGLINSQRFATPSVQTSESNFKERVRRSSNPNAFDQARYRRAKNKIQHNANHMNGNGVADHSNLSGQTIKSTWCPSNMKRVNIGPYSMCTAAATTMVRSGGDDDDDDYTQD